MTFIFWLAQEIFYNQSIPDLTQPFLQVFLGPRASIKKNMQKYEEYMKKIGITHLATLGALPTCFNRRKGKLNIFQIPEPV